MATLAIVLNTTYKLNNGEYAVALRATHDRKQKYLAMSTLIVNQTFPFKCTTEHWISASIEDSGLGRFRKTYPHYKECNDILRSKLEDARKILKRYDDENSSFSFAQFEADLKNKQPRQVNVATHVDMKSTVSIYDYYTKQILILEEQRREGTAGLFRENRSILKMFRAEGLLTEIDFRFLESFEYWLRNVRNNMDTSISVKMRNLQRVINLAIDDGIFPKERYPFGEKKYSVNKRLDHSTKKIAIKLDKVSKLKALELEPGSALHFAQQLFLFSYYCRGINFIDITFLKWTDMKDSTLSYTRKKTRGKFNIPLNNHALSIVEYFRAQRIDGNYIFPILNPEIHVTTKQQYTRKKTALKAVNDNLKKLAKLIDEPGLKLTTNVGRHTYATGLKHFGANTAYITEALGHATQEQTETYLAEFEQGVIESWENKMFNV